jgi:FHS family Na+ dependent glucose MFS transporter 1
MTQADAPPSQRSLTEKRPIAYALFAAILLEGIIVASIGPTLDSLGEQSRSTTEQISILFTANALGYLLGSLLAGRVFGRYHGSRTIAISLAVAAVFAALVPVLGSLWLLIVVFAAIGIPLGMVDVGSNTLLVWLFRRDVAPYMNALHLSFGIGAFLAPLLIDRYDAVAGDAADTYWLFAALMVPVAVWLARVPDPDQPVTPDGATTGGGVVRRHGWFLGLMALFFFTHVGAELGYGGWIFNYAEELEIGGETTARVLNSVFWGGLVVGRLIAIPLS